MSKRGYSIDWNTLFNLILGSFFSHLHNRSWCFFCRRSLKRIFLIFDLWIWIKLILTLSNDNCRYAVANNVRNCSCFRHKTVYPDQERHSLDWNDVIRNRCNVAASVTKPEPVIPAAPFEVSMSTPMKVSTCIQLSSTPYAWAINNPAMDK